MNAPLKHGECIVDTQAIHFINAERFEFSVMRFVAGQVSAGAGRSERARQGENNHFFSSENFIRGDILPAEGVRTFNRFITNAGFKGTSGTVIDIAWVIFIVLF